MTRWIQRAAVAAIVSASLGAGGCKRDAGERRAAPEKSGQTAAAAKEPATPARSGAPAPRSARPARFEEASQSAEARDHFQRGMIALHSFWYDEAITQFDAAVAADPGFAMAHWGAVMSRSKLLWGDDDLAGGRAALARMPPAGGLPPREQAWIGALGVLFAKGTVRQSRTAFAAAMEKLHAAFPDDESTTFLAVALLATTRPEDPAGAAVRERAAKLAKEVYDRDPKHPGAAHYLIHAYDTPENAHLALPMARTFASTAPEAFHARHMPAHIFARLGMWKDAVTSCQSAWDASVAWAARTKRSADHHDFHSLTWLIEIGFERGRREDADAAMKLFADQVKGGVGWINRVAYAKQVNSYAARTGEWKRVDALLAPLKGPVKDELSGGSGAGTCAAHAPQPGQPPFALLEQRAVLNTRMRAAAMRRDVAATRRLAAERTQVDDKLAPFYQATQGPAYAARAAQDRAVSDAAMMARATGDDAALIDPLGVLVQGSRAEYAAEGTAGGNLPLEELADALLRLERTGEAMAAYKEVLRQHPGRGRSLLGAARAALQAGDQAGSRGFYEKLLAVWSEAEPSTPGLAEARKAVKGT